MITTWELLPSEWNCNHKLVNYENYSKFYEIVVAWKNVDNHRAETPENFPLPYKRLPLSYNCPDFW